MKLIHASLKQLAKNLRSSQTDAEKLLWKHLRSRQIKNAKFRRQQPIGNYIVDFISFDNKLIIELDGGQQKFLAKIRKEITGLTIRVLKY
ncbi:MAG: endonuclease domain-containing protein [Smithellaceae bacterium]